MVLCRQAPNRVGSATKQRPALPLRLRIATDFGEPVAILNSSRHLDVIDDQGMKNSAEVFCASLWVPEDSGRGHQLEARFLEDVFGDLAAEDSPADAPQER